MVHTLAIFYLMDFNPRTPHGVRLTDGTMDIVITAISIHAPLTGCDGLGITSVAASLDFNPRTPHGVRLFSVVVIYKIVDFNPRTP